MKKQIILPLILLIFLTACGSRNAGNGNASAIPEESGVAFSDTSSDMINELAADSPSEYDFAPRGFTTPEGIPTHQFSSIEAMDFKANAPFDGQYLLLISLQGNETVQVQADSDELGLHNENIPVTAAGEYGIQKLLDLSAGEYTFTAESLNENECSLLALLRPVQRLEALPDTLEGNYPYTYLCTFPEDTVLKYTFQDLRDSSDNATYGTMAAFYNTTDNEWSETINMNNGDSEVTGSIQIPAGDILICFHTSNWRITFE